MYRFEHVVYLWLLVSIPILLLSLYLFLKWQRSTIDKLGNRNVVMQQFMGYIPNRFKVKTLLFIGALFFLILALANWQKGSGNATAKRKGVDIMIALDVSKSMWAKDLQPDRLSRAKLFVNKLLDKVENDRVGLIVFAGNAYLQVPITSDHAALKMMLQAVSPDMVPTQGTEVGVAINLACSSLSGKNRNSKTIILISDGEDHDDIPNSLINSISENNINLITIGVGQESGTTIPIKIDGIVDSYKKDNNGDVVITKRNSDILLKIASSSGGEYIDGNSTEDALEIVKLKLEKIDKSKFESSQFVEYKQQFQIFILLSLLFTKLLLFP